MLKFYTLSLGILTTVVSMGGCASEESVQRPIPREIVVRAEVGEFTLVCDPPSPTATLPESVPVITIKNGTRYQGLLLTPGTESYNRIVPHGITPDGRRSMLRVPTVIQPYGKSWKIDLADFSWEAAPIERSQTHPLEMWVLIDPPGSAKPAYGLGKGYDGILLGRCEIIRE